MGIRYGDSPPVKSKSPIVAKVENEQYGLYVGPDGAWHKAGIQCKSPKWANLFTVDPDGVSNMLNVVEYVEKNSEDFVTVQTGIETFIRQYQAWAAKRAA
jgi:hypothetical protein